MKKPYLAIFVLLKPTSEHAKIKDVIRGASGGDFKQFSIPSGVGYVYMSERLPWQLSFDRILMSNDSVLISEIGEKIQHIGFGAVEGWLNSHFPKPK